ncbi:MAG TPA: MarC family protein [Terriglobales bacterium]|jgi:multiple antibiotic resistance protein|nr:MarC family protein [Terriglobales bacterium]
MLIVLKYFALGFSALLPVINPLGSALVFLGLVGYAPSDVFRRLARKIALSTTIFLLTVELVGATLLNFFGISLGVVQVAGGFVLAAMGWSLLNEKDTAPSTEKTSVDSSDFRSLDAKVFYPFTFPVTAGPGCIVIMLTLSAHASGRNVLDSIFAHIGILLAVVVLSFTVFLSYRYAMRITQKISPPTVHGILRVIAFILLCIGVQIAWNGTQTLIHSVAK